MRMQKTNKKKTILMQENQESHTEFLPYTNLTSASRVHDKATSPDTINKKSAHACRTLIRHCTRAPTFPKISSRKSASTPANGEALKRTSGAGSAPVSSRSRVSVSTILARALSTTGCAETTSADGRLLGSLFIIDLIRCTSTSLQLSRSPTAEKSSSRSLCQSSPLNKD